MPYVVFARKWRPQKFDDVVGQEHITQTLKNSIQNGKLAQAYLFVGPRGVGKTSCARILAKSLNCKDAPTVNPCGKCSACKEISEGRSLDVIEVDGASNRGIDEIRTLRENVKFSPTSGTYKIYIIDEVHMLTQEAFNALLKTLEEPPEHVKFIFATTRPDKVLPTILSRCQRFEFHRIPTLKIISKLEEIAKSEKISIDKEVFFNIAKISDGSMRDAESVLDQLTSFSKGKIKIDDIVEVMGLIEQDLYFDFVNAIKDKNAQFCIDFVAKLFKRGKDISKFLEGLLWHLRNLMLAKIMKSDLEELLDLPSDIIKRIVQQGGEIPLSKIVNLFSAVTSAQDMAKKIGSFRIPLEVMIVKLTQPLSDGGLDPAMAQGKVVKPSSNELQSPADSLADSGERKLTSRLKLDNVGALFIGSKDEKKRDGDSSIAKGPLGPIDQVEAKPNIEGRPAQDLPQVDFAAIKGDWDRLVTAISQKKMSVATYLRDSKPISLKEETLTVGFPKRSVFYKEAVEQKHNQKIISAIIKDLFHRPLSLKFELVEETENKDASGVGDASYLKSVVDTFKGRVFER
ncbi:DNA polymerase III subunit gamma/tau [Thermoproteota archaeon]